MFESMKKRVEQENDIETIIGCNTTLIGQLQSGGNLRVDGRIDGGIVAGGDVIIGASGIVIGDIQARSLVVAGSVTGNVEATGNLSIHATGQLAGDVRVKSLNIADGGVFQGRSEMALRDGGGSSPQPAA